MNHIPLDPRHTIGYALKIHPPVTYPNVYIPRTSTSSCIPMIRVLYVDDEPDLLQIAKLFLERSNEIVVDTLDSPVKGLDTINLGAYSVIVSDYLMPDMDGIEFLKQIRARYDQIPFILFTGRGREEVVIDAINYGADFYIQKGGDAKSQFAELAHKIRQVVRRSSAEGLMQQSESWLQSIIRYSDDMITLTNQNGAVIYSSPAAERILGYSSTFLIGKNHLDFVHPDDTEMVRVELVNAVDDHYSPEPVYYRIRKADGAYIHVESVFTCLLDVIDIRNLVITTRDITDLKRTESTLMERLARHIRAAKMIHAGHWVLFSDTNIVTVSDGARDLFGLSEGECALADFNSHIVDEDRAGIEEGLKALATNGKPFDVRYKFTRNDGGSPVAIHSVAEYDPEKRTVFGVSQEITG
jgi:PAS domain S-box-containing protein